MNSISNEDWINFITSANGCDDTIYANISSLINQKVMKITNQVNIFIDDYFYYIRSQVIETFDSDYDIDMKETHKRFFCLTCKYFFRSVTNYTKYLTRNKNLPL